MNIIGYVYFQQKKVYLNVMCYAQGHTFHTRIIQGGYKTILVVRESVVNEVTILVMKDSGSEDRTKASGLKKCKH